jgi:RNase adapter protein RapZ
MSASQSPTQGRTQVVVVTGLSGAGKSTAIHALEDLGFYCCDNLPTGFAPEMVDLCERGGIHRIALGFDARLGNFLVAIDEVMDALDASGTRDLHVMFIDASDESIVRRFSETRRPHPLAPEGDVLEGIQEERERLAPLRARATRVLDTTRFTVHELRRALVAQFSPLSSHGGDLGRMMTRIVSFGFKFGAPVDCDIVLDVRFIANPFFVPHMKHRPGTDADVAAFVLETPEAQTFVKQVEELLSSTIPLYAREGKAYLTGIGCTGGRHRSVAVSEELTRRLRERSFPNVHVMHRDVARGDVAGSRGSDPGPIEPPFLPYTRPSRAMEERQSTADPSTDTKAVDTKAVERRGS